MIHRRANEKRAKIIFPLIGLGLGILLALTVLAPSAGAFPAVGTCVGCHPIWTGGGGAGHTGHNGLGLPGSCSACHIAIGDTPVTARCGGCHVVLGVAAHHQNAGAASCTGCHPGTPAPENTAVPGYANITAALNPCNGSEERFASLTVSLDNDGDLLTDGADPDCAPPPETDCNDGIDNDGDGLIDCADQDCAANPACQPPETETACADDIDNDNDGLIDCADPDCTADPACQPPGMEICNDNLDNDGDGLIDCADPNCANDAACQPPTMEICNDQVDNDGDGMIDCADQDCAMFPGCQAPVMENCTDGLDNDGDGFIDCRDPDCRKNPACKKVERCPQFNPPASHTKVEDDDGCRAFHAPGYEKPFSNGCTACHGSKLTGAASGGFAPSCFTCHGREWEEKAPGNSGNAPPDHTVKRGKAYHQPGLKYPFANGCTDCHGSQLTGPASGGFAPSCYACHKMKWKSGEKDRDRDNDRDRDRDGDRRSHKGRDD